MWHDSANRSGIPYSQFVVLRSLSLDGFVFGGGGHASTFLCSSGLEEEEDSCSGQSPFDSVACDA